MIALGAYLVLLMLKAWGALRYARRYPESPSALYAHPVTACQPILSGDPDLESCLDATVTALEGVSFIWLIDDDDVTAADVTRRLAARHSSSAIKILICPPPPDGVNPKLFKLERARALVGAGVVLVLDDDTRLSAKSLAALTDALARCELATGLPFYRRADNLFCNLLAQFVNNNAALTYLPILNLAPPVSINGMCYAMRVETLTSLGGFTPLQSHLTDDLAVADAVRSRGGWIIQTPYPQEVGTTIRSARQYVAQMHRWHLFALLLMRRRPIEINLLLTLFYAVPPLLLGMGLVLTLTAPQPAGVAICAATLVARGWSLAGLQRALTGRSRHMPVLSILSELLQPLHLVHALLVRSIRWRTRRYRVYDNDRFVSL
jgi:ceramide glucosyltransferase